MLDAIDFQYLEDLKAKVKLLAIAERTKNNTLTLMVAPHVLDMHHPLAQVDGALNAIEISGLAE
jgi:homoserine dehydrogenase